MSLHDRAEQYRAQIRETFQAMSSEALAHQNTVIRGGIDREELDRELERRRLAAEIAVREELTPTPAAADAYNAKTARMREALTRADVTRYELEGIGELEHRGPIPQSHDDHPDNDTGDELADRIGDEGSPRYCPECGADIIGNDPHAPDCPRAALELETITVTVDAMAPEELRVPAGITAEILPNGLAVKLTGPPADVLELLLEQWGDEEWARATVADADTAPNRVVLELDRAEADLLAAVLDFGGIDNDNLSDADRDTCAAIAARLAR